MGFRKIIAITGLCVAQGVTRNNQNSPVNVPFFPLPINVNEIDLNLDQQGEGDVEVARTKKFLRGKTLVRGEMFPQEEGKDQEDDDFFYEDPEDQE